MKVRLIRSWLGTPAGSTISVSERIGKQLVRDHFAKWVDESETAVPSAAPKARKILRPEVVK